MKNQNRQKAKSKVTNKAVVKRKTRDYLSGYWLFSVCLLIVLLVGSFILKNMSFHVYEQRKKLAIIKAENERLKQLPQELQSWEKEINLIEGFFPNREKIISFFDFLEKISPPASVNFNFHKTQATTDSLGQPFLRFALTSEGDFSKELSPFLFSLFQGPYFVFPERFSLESTSNIFEEAKISLSGRIYVDRDFLNESVK